MPQKPLWEPGALALEIFVTRLSQMSELKTIRSKRHLFLGGGGYKTLTFLSVLDVIGWSHWQSATGVSAGALLALMLALGYNFQESDEAVLEHEEEFLSSVAPMQIWKGKSPLSPDLALRITSTLLARKNFNPETTMSELKARRAMRFAAIAFCIDTSKLILFTADTHPGMKVADVVASSVAIPFLLPPTCGGEASYYDAGIINSAPLGFSEPESTLALIVRRPHEPCGGCFQTAYFRCSFVRQMSLEFAQRRGMCVLQVPVPKTGVGVLTRMGTPLVEFHSYGVVFAALFIIRREILGLLAMLLSLP